MRTKRDEICDAIKAALKRRYKNTSSITVETWTIGESNWAGAQAEAMTEPGNDRRLWCVEPKPIRNEEEAARELALAVGMIVGDDGNVIDPLLEIERLKADLSNSEGYLAAAREDVSLLRARSREAAEKIDQLQREIEESGAPRACDTASVVDRIQEDQARLVTAEEVGDPELLGDTDEIPERETRIRDQFQLDALADPSASGEDAR